MLDVRVLRLGIASVPAELEVTALEAHMPGGANLLDAVAVVLVPLVVTRMVLILSHTP